MAWRIGQVACWGILSVGIATWGAEAQSARVVTDLNPSQAGQSSNPSMFAALADGTLLFSATNRVGGTDPWVSDGTPGATHILRDIQTDYVLDRSVIGLTPLDASHAVFMGIDGAHKRELWITDGTEAGTHLVKDINPNGHGMWFGQSSYLNAMTIGVVNGVALFAGDDGVNGVELWASDGTEAGTRLLLDIMAGAGSSNPQYFVNAGDRAYFWASSEMGQELWVTDGTPEGTSVTGDILTGNAYYEGLVNAYDLMPTAVVNGKLFYSLNDRIHGQEAWVSDGTLAGTHMLKDLDPDDSLTPQAFTAVGDQVYFVGYYQGAGLYKSDGTDQGTSLVQTFYFMSERNVTPTMAALNGRVYFTAGNGMGLEVWTSNGSTMGTWAVDDIAPGDASSAPRNFTTVGNRVYFTADDGVHGRELWFIDGPYGPAHMARDIWAGPTSSDPKNLRAANGQLVFTANDGVKGVEAWISDGSAEGTRLLADCNTGTDDASISRGVSIGDRVLFTATSPEGRSLYVSDGTSEGTLALRAMYGGPSGPRGVVDGVAYFTGVDDAGTELWRSDGTVEGTFRVADLRPGSASSSPSYIDALGNGVVFIADNGSAGRELYYSDGTAAGTGLVRNILPEAATSSGNTLFDLTVVGGRAYFLANDGVHGAEPWTSDGTDEGTYMIADLTPGQASSGMTTTWGWPRRCYVQMGDRVYTVLSTPDTGYELFSLSATPGDIHLVSDVHPGPANGALPNTMFAWNGRLYFVADDALHGKELWSTDGSAAGTRMVKDIAPGTPSGFSKILCEFQGRLWFTASSGGSYAQLWSTDGTESGTTMTIDVSPDSISSYTVYDEHTELMGGDLYFWRSGRSGLTTLWRTDGTLAGTEQIATERPAYAPAGGPRMPLRAGNSWLVPMLDSYYGEELFAIDIPCNDDTCCPACPADFNSDQAFDPLDIDLFLGVYERGGACADVDGDGGITPGDAAAFFAMFADPDC